MSTALLEIPAAGRLFEGDGREGAAERGAVTLEERLNAAWRALQTDSEAECPVCHGRLRRQESHGECGDCRSRLA